MDRRDFLTTGAGAAAALAITTEASSAHAAALIDSSQPGTALRRAHFESWLRDSFRVRSLAALRSARAMLVAVEDGPRHHGLEQFHVVFESDGALPSGFCELSHDSGANFALWLDPHGNGRAGAHARATFSLIISA